MSNKIINKDKMIEIIIKALADKEIVRSFLKGDIPIETLTKKILNLQNP